jgi:phenylalanyl-tRNA synthetase beta chain
VYGTVHPQVLQQYDLRNSLFYADFSMEALMQFSGDVKVSVTDIPKFPSIYRDIAIIVSKEVPYSRIEKVIGEAGGQLLTDHHLFDIYEKEVIGKDKRSLAISLIFQDATRTLSDAEVNKALDAILKALEKETGAVLR